MSADNIVYSTEPGWKPPCPQCGQSPCRCPGPRQAEPVRVSFRRGHKGSGLTLIERLQMHPAGKEELLQKLKKKLGAGGTIKNGVLEIQGDRRDAVAGALEAAGFKVRRLG